MKKYVYDNTNITCSKQDKKVVIKLKKWFKVSSTNDVVHKLLHFYIKSGEIEELQKPIVIGVKYYNDMYNK